MIGLFRKPHAAPGCPHCGAPLPEGGSGCAACPQTAGCALVCCPGCGRSFPHPRRAAAAYRLARIMARKPPPSRPQESP